MRYAITYSDTADHQIAKLRKRDRQMAARIKRAIEAMAEDPFAGNVKRMKNVPYYRRRVGDWRIIFDVDGNKFVIKIVKVDHRRQVYRR